MSYEFYKIIHIISIIVLVGSIAVSLLSETKHKILRIAGMVSGLTTLVAGMGLLARMYPGESWPTWVSIKVGIWLLIFAGSASLSKKLSEGRGIAFAGILILFALAVGLAVLKPF